MFVKNILLTIQKALLHPDKVYKIAIKKIRRMQGKSLWYYNMKYLREPKVESWVSHDPLLQDAIKEELKQNDFTVIDLKIDLTEYKQYLCRAKYHESSNYYGGGKAPNFIEKSLEHYLAAKLLDLNRDDTYIDIANAQSPVPEIYRKLYGCKAYRQDLDFPAGIHGNVIGGDAGRMPVEDGFATKMALHCSFEHFEGDSDIRFIKESSRILDRGGKLCILPLYLHNEYSIQTDLAVLPKGRIAFEEDAVLYCAKNWEDRHGRFYDVPHLIGRIRNNMNNLKLTIYSILNEKEADLSCYVKFIALFEKV